MDATKRQPAPIGDGPVVLPEAIAAVRRIRSGAAIGYSGDPVADLRERALAGEKKYGTPLRAHNGRDALVDAYQEALDLVMYLSQLFMEHDFDGSRYLQDQAAWLAVDIADTLAEREA